MWYRAGIAHSEQKWVPAVFFRTAKGREPVREWLKAFEPIADRKRIGVDIRTVEYGWPLGMPVCRALGEGLHEVRSDLPSGRTARVLFYIDRLHRMVLLHGFVKKTQQTPKQDFDLARRNQRLHESALAGKN